MTNELHVLREKCLERTKRTLKLALGVPDRRIAQAVSAISELEEALCVSSERLKEWYSLYYPEAASKIKKQEAFARIVAERKSRQEFSDITQDSIGAELSGKDLFVIREFASALAQVYTKKGEMEEYLDKLMLQSFPNLQSVAGTVTGAKLIAHCGDAARLANLPSSTIQVLGAEKALFRHMKTGSNPPKYGILLGHNLVQNARKDERGKVARAVASMISMAIKIDVYSKENCTEMLKKKLENKINVIKRKSGKPKKPKEFGAKTPEKDGARKLGDNSGRPFEYRGKQFGSNERQHESSEANPRKQFGGFTEKHGWQGKKWKGSRQ